ncbi:SMP-30/gluconolactonase/LRE family protein [Thalassobaculum sp. OXR-137]|uniref:SMP-30/gluconolactonase/LRE family protein n=1 Tax=Thalassobaculum sp. OXR-137 TaxID=3100173 RepID=UPI002AC90654|nr:SMP-30/gluconolactonase/LRE family protein [Thalassobaculum sp. OXR-137]WPZ34764.1 SMP-30/gluconolactonase/LRE family protein [Thalassobaculum sp. OXR-137]
MDFVIAPDAVSFFGRDLRRPECVACTQAGAIWVSHALPEGGGGVARLDEDGTPHFVVATEGAPADFMPNGWSMAPDGSFLIANLGDSGGAWRLFPDGTCTPLLLQAGGYPVPPVNFVHLDEEGRVWISISTCRIPRDRAFHRDVADGFVILMDAIDRPETARIVADGLGYTNEVKVDPSGRWLYANETMARRLSRYELKGRGLGNRESVVDYIDGVIPDGFEFDAEGGVWCASVMSNRLVRVAPDGSQHVILEDCDPAELAPAMARWRDGSFTRDDMMIGARRSLRNIASITFGGPDLKTVYCGSLAGEGLVTFRSPVAGAVPPHWTF